MDPAPSFAVTADETRTTVNDRDSAHVATIRTIDTYGHLQFWRYSTLNVHCAMTGYADRGSERMRSGWTRCLRPVRPLSAPCYKQPGRARLYNTSSLKVCLHRAYHCCQ